MGSPPAFVDNLNIAMEISVATLKAAPTPSNMDAESDVENMWCNCAGRGVPRTRHLPAEYRQLVPEHGDLYRVPRSATHRS
jgi:hypothetical protein